MLPVHHQRTITVDQRTTQILSLATMALVCFEATRRAPMVSLLSFCQLGVASGATLLFGWHLIVNQFFGRERIENWSSVVGDLAIWLASPDCSKAKLLLIGLPAAGSFLYLTRSYPNLAAWIAGWIEGALLTDWSLTLTARLYFSHYASQETLPSWLARN